MTPDPQRSRRWLFVPAVLVGFAVLALLVSTARSPETVPPSEPARAVRVIAAPLVDVVPRVLAHGNVEPATTWDAIAEVSGTVVEVHPRLERGALVDAGEVLIRIDPTDYALAVAQVEADIEATESQLAEMAVAESNTRASLEIERQALDLAEKELERKRRLLAGGSVSSSDVDRESRGVLTQRQSIQSLTNTLNLYPVQGKRLDAELARYRARLAAARRDLEHTTVRMPFTGRLTSVDARRHQFVRAGDRMVGADGIDKAEVVARVPLAQVRKLVHTAGPLSVEPAAMRDIGRTLGLSARVRLRAGGVDVAWDARVARFTDALDLATRTVGVVVEVDRPYDNVRPGVRPPLLKGLFVEVALAGPALPARVVVPSDAVHDGAVYLVDGDRRLARRDVGIAWRDADFAVVESGLEAGERIVVSDLVPAIDGMLLRPADDPALGARLVARASGTETAP